MLLRYKTWADEVTFNCLRSVPEIELSKARQTNFGTILRTLNHVYVVDDIFRHHLEGRPHSYTSRNTDTTPTLEELFQKQAEMNNWLLVHLRALNPVTVNEIVRFMFVGGGEGEMTRETIFLHLVNHATYHRGFVSDMLYQIPIRPPANDLPVFLRGVERKTNIL